MCIDSSGLGRAPPTIQPAPKKDALFKWDEEQQSSFQKVKNVFSSPLTMISSLKGLPLTLFLTSIDKSIGTLLEQEV